LWTQEYRTVNNDAPQTHRVNPGQATFSLPKVTGVTRKAVVKSEIAKWAEVVKVSGANPQ